MEQNADGDQQRVTVQFDQPVRIHQVAATLDERGYRHHPFYIDTQRVMQVDTIQTGISPEADNNVAGAVTNDGSRALIVFRLEEWGLSYRTLKKMIKKRV